MRTIAWHCTAPERADIIEREGLHGRAPVFSYNHVAHTYERLHGAGVQPIYVALEQPRRMGIAGMYKIGQHELQCFAVDVTGIALHVDIPVLRACYPLLDHDDTFQICSNRELDQDMIAALRRAAGDAATDRFDYMLLLDEQVRHQAQTDGGTAIVLDPIGPERILARYDFDTAWGMAQCPELIPGCEDLAA